MRDEGASVHFSNCSCRAGQGWMEEQGVSQQRRVAAGKKLGGGCACELDSLPTLPLSSTYAQGRHLPFFLPVPHLKISMDGSV